MRMMKMYRTYNFKKQEGKEIICSVPDAVLSCSCPRHRYDFPTQCLPTYSRELFHVRALMGPRTLQVPLLVLPEPVLDSFDAIQLLYVSLESLDFAAVEFVARY